MREVEIQARVGGTITSIAVCNGSQVCRGDTLVRLDNREYRVAFERARSGLLNAQIEYRTLSATPFLASTDSLETASRIAAESRALDSLRVLSRSGRMDDATYERLSREREAALAYLTASRGDVIAARSGLATAREAFETARLNLEWTSVTAPFKGFVADCALSTGMHVNAGQPLMQLVDLSTLLVDVEILENETGRLAVGQRARAHLAGFPGKEFSGSVLSMNPLVDPKTKTMKVTIALKDGRQRAGGPQPFLRPGMFATADIETDVHPHRLLVPRSALLVRDERSLVFTVDHGRAKWHYVETGEANDELLEIRSGLAPGDTVIVDGHYTLAHDAPVSITRRSP
jgi:HlyD family secretion protein